MLDGEGEFGHFLSSPLSTCLKNVQELHDLLFSCFQFQSQSYKNRRILIEHSVNSFM
jgi:hypothetical protein